MIHLMKIEDLVTRHVYLFDGGAVIKRHYDGVLVEGNVGIPSEIVSGCYPTTHGKTAELSAYLEKGYNICGQ